jgi:glycosyltransferase involved in cell wall biosynthesis
MNIELFSNEENCGLAITRNRLIELSQGKGFIFIDSDDEFYNANSIMNLYKASNNIENDITMGKTKFVGTLKKNGISPITKL